MQKNIIWNAIMKINWKIKKKNVKNSFKVSHNETLHLHFSQYPNSI